MILLAFIVTAAIVVAVAVALFYWIDHRMVKKRGRDYGRPPELDTELPPVEPPFIGGWNEFRTIWTDPEGRRFTKQAWIEHLRE